MRCPEYETRQFEWNPLPFIPQLQREARPKGRFYVTPKGKALFSVTSFLAATKPQEEADALEQWRLRVGAENARRISHLAASKGTSLHLKCEKWLNNEGVILTGDPSADYDFHALAPQLAEGITGVRATEVQLYSERLGLAGTVDALVYWKGKLAIMDFKTSNNFKRREWVDGYFLQCLIYAMMVYELYGEMPALMVLPIFTQNDISVIYEAEPKEYLPQLKQRLDVWSRIKDEFL